MSLGKPSTCSVWINGVDSEAAHIRKNILKGYEYLDKKYVHIKS